MVNTVVVVVVVVVLVVVLVAAEVSLCELHGGGADNAELNNNNTQSIPD